MIPAGSKLFLCSCALFNCAYKCYKVFLYSLSPINCFLSTYVIFFLSFSDYNIDTLFRLINSKSVKTFSFSFFFLVNALDYLKPLIISYEETIPLSSSFSFYSFLMNTLIFCSAFALFFFQISTLCL